MAHSILIIGILYFLAHLFSAVFARYKVPDVLLLIGMGIVLGPVAGLVAVGDFGKMGAVLVTLALIVILFEGGSRIHYSEVASAFLPALALTLLSCTLTTLLVYNLGVLVFGLLPQTALLLGAILCCIAPSVVFPLAQMLDLSETVRTILVLEAALGEVISIVLTIALLESVQHGGGLDALHIAAEILIEVGLATLVGALGAALWLWVINAVRAYPNTLFTTLGFLLLLYGAIEHFGYSGAVSAFVFGWMVNNYHGTIDRLLPLKLQRQAGEMSEREREVHEELVFVLKAFFFIYLGISMRFDDPTVYFQAALLIGVLYGLRFPLCYLVLRGKASLRDIALSSAMAPKGLASAVLASLPLAYGLYQGLAVEALAFATVVTGIVITSILIMIIELFDLRRAARLRLEQG